LRLGLSPEDFWRLSLCEWAALLEAALGVGAAVMDAAALNSLLQQYPDKTS